MVERVASMVVSLSLVDLEEETERESCGSFWEWSGFCVKPVVERNLFWRGLMSSSDCVSSGLSQPLPEYFSIQQIYKHTPLPSSSSQPIILTINTSISVAISILRRMEVEGLEMCWMRIVFIFASTIFMINSAKTLLRCGLTQLTRRHLPHRPIYWTPVGAGMWLTSIGVYRFSRSGDPLRDSEQTFQLVRGALQEKADYAAELQKSMNEETPSFNNKMSKQQIRIQLAKLAPLLSLNEQIKATLQNITDLIDMIKQTKDHAEKEILNQEIAANKLKLIDYQEESLELMVPPAPYDKADDVILELRPGAGGAESSIFVEDISSMYQSFCGSQGWKCWISNAVKQTGVSKGYKVLDMRVQGEGCHKVLKCESGVHKVIRVPETESKGRLHSSTISLVVMPVVPFSFEVEPKDIKYQFTRSSGPGGQAVNKIQSACRAIHIPSGLAVFIQQERSQDANKKRATEILKQKLFEIQYKKSVEEEQSKRKSQVTTLDRSQKIRTYNYPQDRVTDHRTGLTKFGIGSMMRGEMLEEFIESYIESVKEEKVSSLILELYQQAGIKPPKG